MFSILEKEALVNFYSLNGRKILSKKLQKGTSSLMLRIPSGIYVVELDAKTYSVYEKISVEK